MTCVPIKNGFMCFANIYEMKRCGKTYLFEWHYFCGPMELRKKDHEPKLKIQSGFWDAVEEFQAMTKAEREHYRVWA